MNKVASYLGNIGKSVGFMAIDVVKDYTTTSSEFIAQNKDLFKEIYSGIRNYRQTVRRTGELIKQTTVYDSGNKLIENIFDDIRTGNFYNRERIDKYEMEALGMDDFNLEMDRNSKDDLEVEITAEDRRASHTEAVIENAVAQSSNLISSTTAKTGQYIVSNMHASDQMRRVENSQLLHSLATGFTSVQAGISNIINFANGPLVTHMQNSTKYYENSIKLMQEQNAMFKEFLEMQREQYKANLEDNKKQKIGYDDIVGVEGTPDLRAYGQMIAKNTKNLLSSEFNMDMILGGGLGGKKGSMLNALLASPISSIATMAMRTLIPTMLKETAKTFNESIQGVFSTIIGRLNRAANDENSGLLGYIGKIFGIKNALKKDMTAGQYKKGPVPFDGHTRNAIINVIPSYLRRIEAALTNQPERVYDSESGKWTSAENVKDTYEKKKKSFRDNAVGDVEKEAHDAVKKLGISDRREEKRLLESISSVLTNMYERGGTFNFNKKNLNGSDYGVADQEMFENAIAVLNALSFKSGGKRGNKNIMALDSNIMRNRSDQTKFMDEQSLNNASIYGLLASGDIDPVLLNKAAKAKKSTPNFNANNPLSMLDKDGNTAYYYMRSILAELRIHRKLLRIGGGTVINENGRTVRNNMITIDGNRYNIDDMTDSDIDKLVKSSGEKSERHIESMREISQNERHREKAEKIRKENGFNDIDFSNEKLARSMIRSNIQTLRIKEEIDERKTNQSYDGSIIKAGRDASNRYERRKKDAKKGKGTFMDQLVAAQTASEKLGVIRDGFAHLTQKPAEMIQGVIESADTHLYNFFFGENGEEDEDGNPIKGFIGKMTHELQNSFNKFNEWMTEKLFKPIMKKLGIESWEDIPRKIFGFFTGNPDAWDDMKKKAGDKVREGLKPYGEAIKTAYTRAKDDVVDAFTGVRDDYYNFRGIDRTTLKGREEIRNRTLSEEERMANIKANDKYGGGYTLDVLREAKGMNFKDKTQRKNYIKAETLRRQGYNIKPEDILNANESEEAAAKLNKLIERAEGQKDKELKRQNMGEIRRKYGIKTSGRRKQMNRYIEDEGYFDGSLEKQIETIKNKIDEITAQGKEVSDEDKSLLANLQKKFGLVSDDTKAKKSELDNIDKEFKEIDDLKKRVESLNQELFPEEIEKHSRLLREKKKAEKNYRRSLRDDLWNDEETRRKFIDKKTEAIYDKYNKEGYNIATHAKGARYITKSGITTISQGEMIIPSELNPYNPYRFSTNKAAEIANEEAIRTRFSNKLAGIIKNRIHRNAEGNDPVTENEDATQPVTPKDAETVVNSEKASEKIVDPNSIIGTLERGISSVGYSLFGKEGQTKEQFDSMMSGVVGQVKSAAPDAVGNGLLGGTLGLLIGGPGAIMMGAAAGAAKGIIGHSESLQNFLFGEIGEDNERTGGIFSKKFQQNFKKFFPDMKNYGIVGGLTLFPFLGPIGGILAGSAIGFAKNSDKLQDYLFGEVNPETGKRDLEEGLIGGANKEKLKKAFPYMGAGAIAGLALGPFGILGNAALGAGVGLLSSTDKFKDIMFGEEDKNGERHGGILGAIRTGVIDPIKDSMEGIKNKVQEFIDEDILEPLKEFIEPFTHGAKNFFGALLKMVGHGINKLFENTIGIPLDRLIKEKIIQPLTGFVSKTLKFLTAPIRAIVSSPFKFLGSIGNLVRKGQIKRGTADDMTADQRMKFRARHWMGFKPDKYKEADSKMAGWFKNEDGTILTKGDEGFDERAEELIKYAQDATDAAYADEDFFMKRKSDLKKQTSGNVSRWFEDNKKNSKNDRMIRDRILRAVNKGNIDKASAYIRQANLSRKESEELQEMIDEYTQQHKVEDAKRKKVLGNKGALEQTKKELAEKFGIKNIDDKDVARLAKDLNTELKANGLKKVKAGVGENDNGTIANILNDKVPGENPLTNVIAKGMEKALEANHKKLERVNQKKDKLGQKYGRQIANGNSGNTRTSEEFDDYIGSRGQYGIKEFGNFMGDAIKGRSNILSRSKFLPFKLAGGAIHLATTPFRTAKGLVDWSTMAAREKSDRKVQRNIAGSMEEMSNGQMDTGLGNKLMRMGKNGEKQSIAHTYKLAKGTNKFNLTEAYLDDIRYHTNRQRRDSDKVARGKGFNNLDDLRQFTESNRADRRYIKKQGWKLKGMDTDDINNLSGLDQYKIKKSHRKYKLKDSGRSTEDIANDIEDSIETHALGGLILKTAGKAAIGAVKGTAKLAGKAVGGIVKGAGSIAKGVTGLGKKAISGVADFASGGIKSPSDMANEKLDNKTTSVVSEHEAVIDANQKESSKLLEDNKKDMKAMTDTVEENVEVDKNQLSVLKEIKVQLSDIWKTQDKSLYQKITDTGKVIRIAHSKDGGVKAANDKDTKEAVDSEQKHRNIMSRIADGIGGLGDKLKGFLGMGAQKDDDGEEKSSWFDKLKNILLTGLGGTIAVASIGHFSKFWDDTIKPWLTGPVANWLSEKLGIDNPDSAVWKIAGTLDNMYSKVVSWFTGDGDWKGSKWSLPGIIKGVYTWTTSGLQLFSENVLPKAVELIISTLPSILMGLGKGIVKGLGKLFSKIFKWGGAKEEDSAIQIKMPSITKLNPNSKPFTTTLMGLSGTDLNTAFPSYNSSSDKTLTFDFADGSSEISMDSETKTNTILNQLNGGQTTTITDGVSAYYDNTTGEYKTAKYDANTKIGGYTLEELTSGTVHSVDLKAALNDFAKQENLSEEEYNNLYNILSTSPVNDDSAKSNIIRTLITQNINSDTNKKRETIRKIMAVINNNIDYYKSNGFTDDQVEEVYPKLYEIATSFDGYSNETNRLNDIQDTIEDAISSAEEKHGLAVGSTELLKSSARSIATGGIQNFRVGKGIEWIGKITKHVPFFKTAGTAIEGAGKGISKGSGVLSKAGKYASNLGNNFMLGAVDQAYKNSTDAALGAAMEAGANASKEATERALQHTAGTTLSKEASERVAKKYAQNAAQTAADDVLKNAAGSLDGVRDKLLSKTGNVISSETGEIVAKESMEKAAKEGIENVAKEGIENAAKNGAKNSGLIARFTKWVGDQIMKLFGDTKVVNFVKKMAGKTSKFAKEGAEQLMRKAGAKVVNAITKVLGERIVKAGTAALAKITSVLGTGGTITLVFAVGDFISGCLNAESIMGVTKDQEISWGQRLCAGLVKCINGFVTLGFIPESILYDLFIDTLGPMLGFDTSSLQEMREEAQKELDEYNLENGTNLTMEEYNKKDSWWAKTKNKVSEVAGKAWDKTKEFAGNAWDKTKEFAGNAWDKTKELAKKAGGAVADKTKEIVGGAMDIAGFIKEVTVNVIKSATDPEYHWDINSVITEEDPLGGVKKTLYQVLKLPLGIVGVVSKVGKFIFDKVKGFVSNVGDGIGDAWQDISSVIKGEYTVFSSEYWKFNDSEGEENPLSIIGKISSTALKVFSIPHAMLGWVGSKVWKMLKTLASGAKEGTMDAAKDILAVAKGQYTIFNSEYWKTNTDEENPISKIGSIIGFVERLLMAPRAMLGWVGSKVWKGIKIVVSGAKEGIMDASADVAAVASGQYTIFNSEYWKANTDEENPISKMGSIFGFVQRVLMAPHAMLGWVGSKIWQGIKALISGAREGAMDASADIAAVASGQYTIFNSEYWKSDNEDDGNPLSKIGSIAAFVTRLFSAPGAMIGYVGTKASNWFKSMISGAKEGMMDASADIAAVASGQYTIFGSEYWKSNADDGNPLSTIGNVAGFATRLFQAPGAMVGYVGTKVGNWFKSMISGVKDVQSETDKIIQKASSNQISVFSSEYWKTDEVKDNPLGLVGIIASFIQRLIQAPIIIFTKVFNKIKEKFDDIKGWFKKLFGEDAESVDTSSSSSNPNGKLHPKHGIRTGSRYGRGKISQLDPSIANMEYNGNTIAEAGCGPVAATNLINAIKGNNNISVENAAQYATEMGYKPENDGTDPRFMNSILSASGIENKNISGRANIKQSLAEGNPVVLMGKGNSEQSPYGKYNPHYITAMGYDSKGNIIIDDPYESDYITYKESDVMNGVMKSTVASRGKGFARKSRHSSGFGKYINRSRIATRKKRFGYGRYGSDMPVGSYVEIPSGLGTYETYMGWHLTTYKGAPEYEFKQQAIKDGRYAAKESCGMTNCATVDDRLVIATVANIGGKFPTAIGDYLDVYFEDGTVWKCIRGETKSQKVTWYDKAPADAWGHDHGKVVVEVVYHNYSKNPKNNYKKVKKIVKAGDYASGKESSTSGSSTDSTTSTSTTSTASTSKPTLFGALSELGTSMVKKIYGEDVYEAIFGSTTQATSTSDGSNSSSGSSNGSISTSEVKKLDGTTVKGPVSSNEHIKKAQIAIANNMYSRERKNSYSQNGSLREQQGSGHSDCSSMCSWSYRQALKNDKLTNQLMGSTLPGWSGYTQSQWEKGTLIDTNKNSSKFQVGDLLFWGSNGKTSHVEMYTGDNTIMGHGSGIGPREKKLSSYNHSKPFMGGKRYITEDIAKQAGYGKAKFGRGKAKFGYGTSYPKYSLSDSQINDIATCITGETGGSDSVAAAQEASQMANLNEVQYGRSATASNIIKTLHGGWYAKSSWSRGVTNTAKQAVRDVLINGKRTLPRYVVEHDMFPGDIKNAKSRNSYKFGDPVSNKYGSNYKFYTFFGKNKKGDIAGYFDKYYNKYKDDVPYGSSGFSTSDTIDSSSTSEDTKQSSTTQTLFTYLTDAATRALKAKYGDVYDDLFGGSSNNSKSTGGSGKAKFGFGKNIMQSRSDKNIQGATVMNLQPNYRSTTQHIAAVNAENNISRSNDKSSSNYIELLKIVIEALLKVADNTEKISMIYDILADKLNIDVSDSRSANDLESKKTRVNNALKRLDTRQTFEGNSPEVSDLDIQAILQMMTSIARE